LKTLIVLKAKGKYKSSDFEPKYRALFSLNFFSTTSSAVTPLITK